MSGNENPPSTAPIMSDLQLKIKPERRAAKIANTKIAESTKMLASTKIVATTPAAPPPKPRTKRGPKVKVNKRGKASLSLAKSAVVNKVVSTKNLQSELVVVTKKSATSILNPAKKLIATNANAPKTLPPTLQGKQVTLLKPLISGKAGTLNKVPVFVLSQGSGQLQSLIPITTTLPANTIISVTSTNKLPVANQQKLVSLHPKITKNEVLKKKNEVPAKSKKSEHKLIMECEEEELSAVQRIAIKKAESEYVDFLRKVRDFKRDPEIEVVSIGADDPLPPLPVQPTVQEASKLPPPEDLLYTTTTLVNDENDFGENSEKIPKITEVQSGLTSKKFAESDSILPKLLTAPVLTEGGANRMKAMSFEADDQSVNNSMMDSELEIKLISQKLYTQGYSGRKELDDLFKELTSKGSLSLEKWMLEKGLFGSSRYCLLHTHVQMKLMYCLNDDQHKSGYKWWCPSCAVMVNVSQGGFFERSKMSCENIMRVVYHWVCNDDITKLISECGNSAKAVYSVYKSLRDICNAQVMRKKIGGANHSVEIAHITIGDCKDTENVLVYCAYDRLSRTVFLGASSSFNIKSCLATMFKTCVAKETTIVGDPIIQPKKSPTLKHAFVNSSPSPNAANLNALAYLRDQVDPILTSYYKKLNLANLQSILDELAWRDRFANNPKDAFFNIIEHIKLAYACSVLSPKGEASLPVSVGAKMKVVATNPLALKGEEGSSVEGTASAVPADITIEDVKECAMEDEMHSGDTDDDDYILPVTADCILEEVSENEETLIIDTVNDTIRTSVIKTKNSAVPVAETPRPIRPKPSVDKALLPVNRRAKVLNDKLPPAPSQVVKPKEPVAIPLETYYYARMDGMSNKMTDNRKYKFKCALCKKVLDENLKMLRHVYSHIDLPQSIPLFNPKCRCNFCFQDFTSPSAKDTHVYKVHSMNMVPTVCKICFKDFPSSTLLLKHMSAKHKRSEMPYHCKVCNCRSSFYQEIINHFIKNHGCSDKLQCRYCLQVFVVKPSSVREEAGISSFWKHLQKHQSKVINRCNYCCLTFVSAYDLQGHVNKDHVSFKNMPGLVPVKVSQPTQRKNKPTPTKESFTATKPTATSTKPMGIFKKWTTTSPKLTAASNKPKTEQVLIRNTELNNFCCIECKASLYRTNHFIQNMVCSMCKFVTSCSRSYANHAIDFHSVPPRKKLKKFHSLDHQLHCLCNFSTNYGDQMARHLIVNKCSYKWCYVESNLELNHANSESV